jgi:hypothetical protein
MRTGDSETFALDNPQTKLITLIMAANIKGATLITEAVDAAEDKNGPREGYTLDYSGSELAALTFAIPSIIVFSHRA